MATVAYRDGSVRRAHRVVALVIDPADRPEESPQLPPMGRSRMLQILEEELRTYLREHANHLPKAVAVGMAQMVGWRSATKVYEMRQRILAQPEFAIDPQLNSFEACVKHGPEAFWLDDLYFTMYQWLQSQAAVHRAFFEALKDLGLEDNCPSRATISRRLKAAPELLRRAVKSGLAGYPYQCLFVRRKVRDVLERGEADEVSIDIEIRHPRGNPKSHRVRLHMLLLIDAKTGFVLAATFSDKAFTASDYLNLMAEAAEPLVDEDGNEYGRLPKYVVFDNARAFTATAQNETWIRIAQLLETYPGLYIDLPGQEAHAPYSWWQKGAVEAAIRAFQTRYLAGLPGRVTEAKRTNGKDAHGQPVAHLLDFALAVGLALITIDKHNNAYSKRLRATRSEYFKAYAPKAKVFPDEVLAELYQPHWKDEGRRIVEHRGVQIDGEWWSGPGVDIDFDDPSWRLGQRTKPRPGETVEVRVLNHLSDPLDYLPTVGPDGKPADYGIPELALRRPYDRAAVFFDGRFTGWVYRGVTPEEVRDGVVANRRKAIDYVRKMAARGRQSARNLGRSIEQGSGIDFVASAARDDKVDLIPDPPGLADTAGDPVTVGQDPSSADSADRPGKRPDTRRSSRRAGERTVPERPGQRPGLSSLRKSRDTRKEQQ